MPCICILSNYLVIDICTSLRKKELELHGNILVTYLFTSNYHLNYVETMRKRNYTGNLYLQNPTMNRTSSNIRRLIILIINTQCSA